MFDNFTHFSFLLHCTYLYAPMESKMFFCGNLKPELIIALRYATYG